MKGPLNFSQRRLSRDNPKKSAEVLCKNTVYAVFCTVHWANNESTTHSTKVLKKSL